jgi:hypothetical protein
MLRVGLIHEKKPPKAFSYYLAVLSGGKTAEMVVCEAKESGHVGKVFR